MLLEDPLLIAQASNEKFYHLVAASIGGFLSVYEMRIFLQRLPPKDLLLPLVRGVMLWLSGIPNPLITAPINTSLFTSFLHILEHLATFHSFRNFLGQSPMVLYVLLWQAMHYNQRKQLLTIISMLTSSISPMTLAFLFDERQSLKPFQDPILFANYKAVFGSKSYFVQHFRANYFTILVRNVFVNQRSPQSLTEMSDTDVLVRALLPFCGHPASLRAMFSSGMMSVLFHILYSAKIAPFTKMLCAIPYLHLLAMKRTTHIESCQLSYLKNFVQQMIDIIVPLVVPASSHISDSSAATNSSISATAPNAEGAIVGKYARLLPSILHLLTALSVVHARTLLDGSVNPTYSGFLESENSNAIDNNNKSGQTERHGQKSTASWMSPQCVVACIHLLARLTERDIEVSVAPISSSPAVVNCSSSGSNSNDANSMPNQPSTSHNRRSERASRFLHGEQRYGSSEDIGLLGDAVTLLAFTPLSVVQKGIESCIGGVERARRLLLGLLGMRIDNTATVKGIVTVCAEENGGNTVTLSSIRENDAAMGHVSVHLSAKQRAYLHVSGTDGHLWNLVARLFPDAPQYIMNAHHSHHQSDSNSKNLSAGSGDDPNTMWKLLRDQYNSDLQSLCSSMHAANLDTLQSCLSPYAHQLHSLAFPQEQQSHASSTRKRKRKRKRGRTRNDDDDDDDDDDSDYVQSECSSDDGDDCDAGDKRRSIRSKSERGRDTKSGTEDRGVPPAATGSSTSQYSPPVYAEFVSDTQWLELPQPLQRTEANRDKNGAANADDGASDDDVVDDEVDETISDRMDQVQGIHKRGSKSMNNGKAAYERLEREGKITAMDEKLRHLFLLYSDKMDL
jgi:hypothetical protein